LSERLGLRVLLDPGGIRSDADVKALFASPLYLIKPNEHETRILTGMSVSTLDDARRAAREFLSRGVANVMITLGKEGALFYNEHTDVHIPIPDVAGSDVDETGCGDQTMAALCARLMAGADLLAAARTAVLAGTLQFHKLGIIPLTAAELAGHRA